MTGHCFRLGNVFNQANPEERSNQYVEPPLKLFWIPRPNDTIVRIEYYHALTHHMSQPIMDKRVIPHCHGNKILDHVFHHHVKEYRRYQDTLCGSEGRPKLGAMLDI